MSAATSVALTRPAVLLLDPGAQVGGVEAERGVPREGGLADGRGLAVDHPVVDRVDGDAPGVGEGGDEEGEGGALPAMIGDGRREDVGLEREVAAQGRVGAGDEGEPLARAVGGGQRGGHDFAVAGGGRVGVEGARVGEDVEGGRTGREGPVEVGGVPAGEDGESGDGLGAGGVVVEDDEHGRRVSLGSHVGGPDPDRCGHGGEQRRDVHGNSFVHSGIEACGYQISDILPQDLILVNSGQPARAL